MITAPSPLRIRVDADRTTPLVTVDGEIDRTNAHELEAALLRFACADATTAAVETTVEVDLSGIDFMDSAALRAFASATSAGCRLRFERCSPLATRLLQVAGWEGAPVG